jgi:DNA (cytosine-5)-methyltransferase 1
VAPLEVVTDRAMTYPLALEELHPWLHRTISVREAARIQGFPDDYVFCGPRFEQPLQVAKAVPQPVARALARHLKRFLPDREGPH